MSQDGTTVLKMAPQTLPNLSHINQISPSQNSSTAISLSLTSLTSPITIGSLSNGSTRSVNPTSPNSFSNRKEVETDYQLEQTYPWNQFSYIPLELRRPTTMVIISYLTGGIDIDKICEILPIDIPDKTPSDKVPENMPDGSIISLRYQKNGEEIKRGIQVGNFWPLAIMFKIFYQGKGYSLRLTLKKIHITGVTSEEMALRISELVIERVKQTRRALDFLRKEPVGKVILSQFYGLVQNFQIQTFSRYLELLQVFSSDYSLNQKDNPELYNLLHLCYLYLNELSLYPLNDRIAQWNRRVSILMEIAQVSPTNLTFSLSPVKSDNCIIDQIVPANIDVLYLYKGNINYAFTLDFALNPINFIELVKQINGFTVVYDPAICPSIRVTVNYQFPEILKDIIEKRDSRTSIGFQIQTHGHIVFTGPTQTLMIEAYNILMSAIYENREFIEGPNPKDPPSSRNPPIKKPEYLQIDARGDPDDIYRRYYSFQRHQLSNFIVDPKELRCNCEDGHLPKCRPRFPIIGSNGEYFPHPNQ